MVEGNLEHQDEIEDKVRKLWRKTDTIFEGGFGVATDGRLTDEGMDKLFDAMRLHGYSFVRK